jgi:hypothetical protein
MVDGGVLVGTAAVQIEVRTHVCLILGGPQRTFDICLKGVGFIQIQQGVRWHNLWGENPPAAIVLQPQLHLNGRWSPVQRGDPLIVPLHQCPEGGAQRSVHRGRKIRRRQRSQLGRPCGVSASALGGPLTVNVSCNVSSSIDTASGAGETGHQLDGLERQIVQQRIDPGRSRVMTMTSVGSPPVHSGTRARQVSGCSEMRMSSIRDSTKLGHISMGQGARLCDPDRAAGRPVGDRFSGRVGPRSRRSGAART